MTFRDASVRLVVVAADGTSEHIEHDTFRTHVARAHAWLDQTGAQAPEYVAFVPRADAVSLAILAACFERGTPVVVLHARATEAENARLCSRLGVTRTLTSPTELPPRASTPTLGELDRERALVVVPTSGTTGDPKGVVLSARAFAASAHASALRTPFAEDDVALLSLPLAHVGGLALFTRALIARATLVLPPPGTYEPTRVATMIDAHAITQVSLVPTMLRRHLDEGAIPSRETLRRVLVGGATASPALLERAARVGLPVCATYGLSEACSQVATQSTWRDTGVGRPLSATTIRIIDGRIAIASDTLFSGYLVNGVVESVPRADGFYVTGDLGALDDDGALHVLGRVSDLVITGGENVMPAEVERALCALEGVRDAVAFGVQDEVWGERLIAVVVPHEGVSLDPAALRTSLMTELARHKVPAAIHVERALPLLPSGKVDRRALASAYVASRD